MLRLYRIHTCIAWYAVKSWHNKYSNTFKELQCFQLWAWQGVGRGGVRRERRRREFLMGSLNGKVFTLPTEATEATALHDSTYVFPRIRVHSTCYKSHAHTHSPHTHTHRHSRSGSEKARKCCCKCNWPKVPSVRVEERDSSLLPRGMLTRCPATPPLLLLLPWQVGSVSAALIEMFRQRVPFKL